MTSEAQLHKQVAHFLSLALPEWGCCWTTFPAGGGGKVRGAKLKASGLRPGWPDVQILWFGGSRPAFIGLELKTEIGRLSPEQVECHSDIRAAGGYVFVCRSVEQVETCLRSLGIPLRAHTFGAGVRRAA